MEENLKTHAKSENSCCAQTVWFIRLYKTNKLTFWQHVTTPAIRHYLRYFHPLSPFFLQPVLTFISQWLLYVPPDLFKKFYVLPTQCIYVFWMDLRTNSDYFPIQGGPRYGSFAQSRKTPIASSCLSVRPHVSMRLQIEALPWNLILGTFLKFCRKKEIQTCSESGKNIRYFT